MGQDSPAVTALSPDIGNDKALKTICRAMDNELTLKETPSRLEFVVQVQFRATRDRGGRP